MRDPILKIDGDVPAFPTHLDMHAHRESGMTLRDHFAALALQGLLASTDDKSQWPSPFVIAVSAYAWADAMLKARAA